MNSDFSKLEVHFMFMHSCFKLCFLFCSESPGQRRNSANSVLEHIPSKALNQAATTIVGGTVYSRPPGNGREPLTNMAITAVRHPSGTFVCFQARNQLGIPGGEKSFLRGPIFKRYV